MPQITWRIRRIEGYGLMTNTQYFILKRLDNLKDEHGHLWDPLADVHGSTINALLSKDMIIFSNRPDGSIDYQITSRGIQALKLFGAPTETRREDGICPECGINPRPDGMKYCRECRNAIKLRRYHTKPKSYRKPGGLCPKCKKNTRYTSPGGSTHSVCIECKREYQREWQRRKRAEMKVEAND